jgi:hypothetical protein
VHQRLDLNGLGHDTFQPGMAKPDGLNAVADEVGGLSGV